ncbi:MAG TPA: anti-sigma factor [Gemmatimonadaceae bacterium]|jgi:anti-sigma factor RsiW
MSDCTNGELRDLLPELMHGSLDAETRRAVEAHVTSCPECAEELALLRALRPALARGPAVDVQRIAAAVIARTTRAPLRSRRRAQFRIAIAAAALLAVGSIGYAIAVRWRITAPEQTAVGAPAPEKPDTTNPVVAPITTPPRRVAAAPPHVASPIEHPLSPVANAGVLDNVSDLSDDDLRALTASLDGLSGLPDADPAPVIDPLGVSTDDISAGGK